MGKERLTFFSDGVIAIIITIMVLEIKVPHGPAWGDLAVLAPDFFSYALSFAYIAIYWNNHHHMLHTLTHVSGLILWANMHLLFWLALIPWATAWVGENHFAQAPTVLYGSVLLMAAIAYFLLQRAIIRAQGTGSLLAKAVGHDIKGKISPLLYATAIALAFVNPWIANAIYILVAAIWLVPDRRIERMVEG